MKKIINFGATLSIVLMTSQVFALTSHTGYSGAPGSYGSCAVSCHGTSGGTIQVSGFPEQYSEGQTYTITITHSGGSSIRLFNGSCRAGSGSANAGVISAGTNTATYTRPNETNGIRLSSTNQNSATFNWTAPTDTTSEARLYIAGLQGSYSGQNTNLILISTREQVGIKDEAEIPDSYAILSNYPNPFNARTNIVFNLPISSDVSLDIYNVNGQVVESLIEGYLEAGKHSIAWNANSYPSGKYMYKLTFGEREIANKMILLK